MAELERSPSAFRLLGEVWTGFRPYFLNIAIDFLISATLWLVLYIFKILTKLLIIDGWAGDFIVNLHAAGAVAAFGVFAILLVIDLYSLHKGRGSHGQK